jgi:pyruvate kinase
MEIAELLGSKFVCVFTEGGDSLRRISRLRSAVPVLSFTPNVQTARELSLVWGSNTFLVPKVTHTDAMFEQVDISVLDQGMCKVGDEVVVVAGTPPGVPGSTNTLRVHKVGTGANS